MGSTDMKRDGKFMRRSLTTLRQRLQLLQLFAPFEGSVCQLKVFNDNRIGLSKPLWPTLICFAAQHEPRHNVIMQPSVRPAIDGFREDTAWRLMVLLC